MAYISVRKNREGNQYVYLVEGYRIGDKVRSRIIKKYGRLAELEKNEPGILERLKSEAKAGLLTDTQTGLVNVSINLSAEIGFDDKNYGWKLLDDVYDLLNISDIFKNLEGKHEYNLDKVMRLLVHSRLMSPASKLKTVKNQELLFGNWNIAEHDVYRSLTHIDAVKENIQLACHKSITKHIGRVGTLVFYDVTNYYFEIDLDDEDRMDEQTGVITEGLRRKGPSKERRPKPIVQLGLFMDMNGIPISYQLFRGNCVDVSTYLPAIEQVKKQFGLQRIVVVADKALNSKKNISLTSDNQDGWLFSAKHRGSRGVSKQLQAFILSEEGWEFNADQSFAKKSMIWKRKKEDNTEVNEKVVVTWRKKYAIREAKRREGTIEYIEKLTNPERFRASCKKGGKKYLVLFHEDKKTKERVPISPYIGIDYDQLEADAKFDGINVLVTSEIEMSDDEIINNYQNLSKIEDCFKITKSDFSARPVYVSRNEHIEAHFLICFLSLIILRILHHQLEWKFSPIRIVDALNSATCHDVGNGYLRVQANDDLKKIHEVFGIDWNYQFIKKEKINQYAKGWFTTFLKAQKNRQKH